ncbi:MAG: SRPBCC family protein [Pseudomonadota bacterium]
MLTRFLTRLCLASLLAALPLPVQALGEARVSADVGFTGIRIEASSQVAADAETLWQTLTDYNRLASFIPDMKVSRLVSPPGKPKLVEQRANAGLFAFVMPNHVVLAMEEKPLGVIRFRAVSGDVATMRGEWVVTGEQAPVRLTYRARVLPLLPPPPLVSDHFVEAEVRQRFEAVVKEAERRMRAKVTDKY